jgi:hypothetical protein
MKKILSAILAAMMFVLASGSVVAAEPVIKPEKSFDRKSGTVTEVNPHYDENGELIEDKQYITIDENGSLFTFVIDKKTFFATDTPVKAGDQFTGFYDANQPSVKIFPPRYIAIVASVNDPMIIVDIFNDKLLNLNQSLVLNIGDQTQILDRTGKPCSADALAGKILVVYTTVVMESFPAQTTPTKIVVLEESAPTPAYLINGNAIDAPGAYVSQDGVTMIPLRLIAKALGYKYEYARKTKTVSLDGRIGLRIGRDSYTLNRMAPIQLGTAPAIKNNIIYVPLSFFEEVLKCENVSFDGAQILIAANAE